MADNVNEIADNVENIQLNVPHIPGAVLPYELPVGEVEAPFEAITITAITESGRRPDTGPLNEERLKELLRYKLNRKKEKTEKIIKEIFTNDVRGLRVQLNNLRSRIDEIVREEKERTDIFYGRIRELMGDLRRGRQKNYLWGPNLEQCNAAVEAFHDVGRGDPLTEDQLKTFIRTGMYPTGAENGLSEQLNRLRRRLDSNLDDEKSKRTNIIEKITKAIADIDKEHPSAANQNVLQ